MTNFQDVFSKTESHEAKLETLEKNIKDLKTAKGSHYEPPAPDRQSKTEQMEFISKKVEEQKRSLELFFTSIDAKIKKMETVHIQEVDKF